MLYLNEKKKTGLMVTIAVLGGLLALLLALLLWAELGAKSAGKPSEGEPPEDTTVLQPPQAEDTGNIDTPYLSLCFDPAFSDCLVVTRDPGPPYCLSFYCALEGKPNRRLFDIAFGEGADGNLGAIRTDNGIVPVSMVIYTFTPDGSWTQDEADTVFAMQEVANALIGQIMQYQTQTDYTGPAVSTEIPE